MSSLERAVKGGYATPIMQRPLESTCWKRWKK